MKRDERSVSISSTEKSVLRRYVTESERVLRDEEVNQCEILDQAREARPRLNEPRSEQRL